MMWDQLVGETALEKSYVGALIMKPIQAEAKMELYDRKLNHKTNRNPLQRVHYKLQKVICT